MQIHEPILTMSGSEGLAADCAACYAELAAVGLPINIVVAYDDVPGKESAARHARGRPVPTR